jgi:hypothetical protein
METPLGRFYVQAKFRPTAPMLGAYGFETSAYSKLSEWPGGGIVGIHGTDAPWLARAGGLARVHQRRQRAILRLRDLVPSDADPDSSPRTPSAAGPRARQSGLARVRSRARAARRATAALAHADDADPAPAFRIRHDRIRLEAVAVVADLHADAVVVLDEHARAPSSRRCAGGRC